MKTNMFKTVLPALAIVMAMGLSFAVELNTENREGFYDDPLIPGIQQVPGGVDCPLQGKKLCKYQNHPVFADEARTIPLYELEPTQ